MQSRHFRLLIVALILCILAYIAFHEANKIIRIDNIVLYENSLVESDRLKLKLNIKKQPELIKQTKPKEVVSDYFSSDPYINKLIIMSEYSDCIEYFKILNMYIKKNNLKKIGILQLKNKVTEQKRRDRMDECDLIELEHPEFNLSNEKVAYKKMHQHPSQTLLEKILRSEIYISEENNVLSQQFIKELSLADPRIFRTHKVFNALSSYHMYYSIGIILDLIHSQQIGYAYDLSDHAQMIYICNMSKTCTSFNFPLDNICKTDERYCGINDYYEYVRIAFSPGHQADIKIVVKYIEELFNSQIHE